MNRSILIVICDFIVLSVLSLSSGTSSGYLRNGGYTRPIPMKKVTEMVKQAKKIHAEKKVSLGKIEDLESKSKFWRERFQDELKQRNILNSKLLMLQHNHALALKKLRTEQLLVEKSKRQLSEYSKNLTDKQKQLVDKQKQLALNTKILGERQQELKILSQQNQANLLMLTEANKHISGTEKELSAYRKKLLSLNEKLTTKQIEVMSKQQQLQQMRRILQTAVVDLSKTKLQLQGTNRQLSQTKGKLLVLKSSLSATKGQLADKKADLSLVKEKLSITQKHLSKIEKEIKNDVFESYERATRVLQIRLREVRLLIDYKHSGKFFLPQIRLKGRCFIPISFRDFAASGDGQNNYEKLCRLSFSFKVNPESSNSFEIKKALSPSWEREICLLETAPAKQRSLNLIGFSKLKKRGVRNLYLFKKTDYGKRSCTLDNRCSLSMKLGDRFLYIRNSTRKSGNLLNAEPGDIVLTKEGSFVGMIVGLNNSGDKRKQTAKCFVIGPDADISNATIIDLKYMNNKKYFTDYCRKIKIIAQELKRLRQTVK